MGRLDNKVALITGSGGGFGEAIAKVYAREGAVVIVTDIIAAAATRVADEINAVSTPPPPPPPSSSPSSSPSFSPARAHALTFDCTSTASWTEALGFATSRLGGLDIVVNNAGTTYRNQSSTAVTEEEFDKILNVNCKSIFLGVKVVGPYLVERKRGGCFLNTSSVAGMKVRPGMVWYGGTKGFVNTITQGLAAEFGHHGIRVNSVCPLRAPTGLLELFSGKPDTPEERERFAKTVPLGRMSTAEDVANAFLYLASDEASFVTGLCMQVDGGRLTV